jgi:hypothetical protein
MNCSTASAPPSFSKATASSPGPLAPPRNLQPDYLLTGQAADLPNRGNGFFQLTFFVIGAKSHSQLWTKTFDVHTGR